jgi:hypothetical protein
MVEVFTSSVEYHGNIMMLLIRYRLFHYALDSSFQQGEAALRRSNNQDHTVVNGFHARSKTVKKGLQLCLI